jgi:ABC-type sugar transport system ATPase subunit
MQALLEVKNLNKYFGGVHALQDFSCELYESEILGLVGDNGAGKSTFIKIISGVHKPTSGEIFWKGNKIEINSPRMARNLGIETIYQDLSLAENLDVPSNIFAGKEMCKSFFRGKVQILDKQKMYTETEGLLKKLGVSIEKLNNVIKDLSGGQKQSVAICRAVYWNAKLIIMDEPTANLDLMQRDYLLQIIRNLKEQGITVIFISHNIDDVFEVTDRIIVLRQGKKVSDIKADKKHEQEVVDLIV